MLAGRAAVRKLDRGWKTRFQEGAHAFAGGPSSSPGGLPHGLLQRPPTAAAAPEQVIREGGSKEETAVPRVASPWKSHPFTCTVSHRLYRSAPFGVGGEHEGRGGAWKILEATCQVP